MGDGGDMARVPELAVLARRLDLKFITIADLIKYRRRTEKLIGKVGEAKLPTVYGDFVVHGYASDYDSAPYVALTLGDVADGQDTLVRIHSSCVTGDLLGSLRCDCGDQLHMALEAIAAAGRGVLLYIEQEGRGIGILNKIRAYALQDQGLDTVDANVQLGFAPDLRDYGLGAQVLYDLGVRRMRLMTNNPSKRAGIEGYGLEIVERLPMLATPNDSNRHYLETKRTRMGHLLHDVLADMEVAPLAPAHEQPE